MSMTDSNTTDIAPLHERARALMRKNPASPVEILIVLAFSEERERCLKLIEPYCNSSSLAQRISDAIEGCADAKA